ncbi:MAG: hypothetical protein ABSA49_10130 [Rhizomicrobium sp.]|jgi:hypothetical protein
MNPLWYVAYFVVIGGATVAAHVIGLRQGRATRVTTQSVREKIQRVFDGGACQGYERLDAIGRRLQDSLGAHGGTHQFTMAQLDRTLHDSNLSYLELGNTIADAGSSGAELQDSLALFCRKYSELVLLLGDVAQQTGHGIAPDDGFQIWARNDLLFTRELGRLTAEPDYQALFRAVRGFFNRDGFAASHSLKSIASLDGCEIVPQGLSAAGNDDVVRVRSRDRISVH